MGRSSMNPVRYAEGRLNQAMSNVGPFTYQQDRRGLDVIRVALSDNPLFVLIQCLSDVGGNMTSIFEHRGTGARVLVYEWHCPKDSDCRLTHGYFQVRATSMEDMALIIDAVDNDAQSLDDFMESHVQPTGYHDDWEGDEYE